MKIEITLDRTEAILECIDIEELKRSVEETIYQRLFLKLENELYKIQADDWSEGLGYDTDRAYKMFKLMTDRFILIPKKSYAELLEDPIKRTEK